MHWKSQVSICNPCLINYDLIIDFDDLSRQSNKLLSYIQKADFTDNKIFFDESLRFSREERFDKTKHFLDMLSREEVTALGNIFESDFEILSHKRMYF